MASSFAAQLKQHTEGTISDLDLKAQKEAHSQSLIFDERVAATQDFDTLYQLCLEGFEDLCKIEPKFTPFHKTLFSNETRTTARTGLTSAQNDALNVHLESFIGLIGARLLLSPAVKALEWLVRRFRVHEYNTAFLIYTFLPQNNSHIFRSLLSILPPLPPVFNWLAPYQSSVTRPPRHAIVKAAINSTGFLEGFNQYALQLCKKGGQSREFLSFWTSITAEAISARLANIRPGQHARDRQHEEFLVTFLPTLAKGLATSDFPDLTIGCYTFIIIMAKEQVLSDAVRTSLLIDVTHSLSQRGCLEPGLICLARLFPKSLHSHYSLPSKAFRQLIRVQNLANQMHSLHDDYDMSSLAYVIATNILLSKKKNRSVPQLGQVAYFLDAGMLDSLQVSGICEAFLQALQRVEISEQGTEEAALIKEHIKSMYLNEELRKKLTIAANDAEYDLASLVPRSNGQPKPIDAAGDTDMGISETPDYGDLLKEALLNVQDDYGENPTFIDYGTRSLRQPLLRAFDLACENEAGIEAFSQLPLWNDSKEPSSGFYHSFLLAVASGPHNIRMRLTAASLFDRWLSELENVDTQQFLPFVICILADPREEVRRSGGNMLQSMARIFPSHSQGDDRLCRFTHLGVRAGPDPRLSPSMPSKQIHKILLRSFVPTIEDCVLDSRHISRVLRLTLKPRKDSATNGTQESDPLKKYLRESLFTLLLDHISDFWLTGFRVTLLSLMQGIESVGDVVKSKKLSRLLQHWVSLEPDEFEDLGLPKHSEDQNGDKAFASIFSLSDDEAINDVINSAKQSSLKRPEFGAALTERVQQLWPTLKIAGQLKVADALLRYGGPEDARSTTFGESTIRSLNLHIDILDHVVENISKPLRLALEPRASINSQKGPREPLSSPADLSHAARSRLRQLIVVAEMITESTASDRLQLVPRLFEMLVTLQQAEAHHQTDLSYFMSLVLDALKSIVAREAAEKLKVASSAFNLDAVIDCMRDSGHHAVHQSALSLLVSLAEVCPERVLATIMPIFTFMGTKMHEKDEYSNDLVDQTINRVLRSLLDPSDPPTMDPRAVNNNVLEGFVTAFEHIPLPKRTPIFKELLMGLQDPRWFLQVTRRLKRRLEHPEVVQEQKAVQDFVAPLFDAYGINDQLEIAKDFVQWAAKIVDLPNPYNAVKNYSDYEEELYQGEAKFLLSTLNVLLQRDGFVQRASGIGGPQAVTVEPATTLQKYQELFVQIAELEDECDIGDVKKAFKKVLLQLRDLLPRYSLILVAQNIVCNASQSLEVKDQVLKLATGGMAGPRSLAVRSGDFKSALTIGLQIADLIPEAQEGLKPAMIGWVGEMCVRFGRSDMEQVTRMARLLASDSCLSPSQDLASTIALLQLTSLSGILEEGIVAIVPGFTKRLETVLMVDAESTELLFMTAQGTLQNLIRHGAFALSEQDLDFILRLCASGMKHADCQKMIGQTLRHVSLHFPLRELLFAIEQTWPNFVKSGDSAMSGAIDMLENAVQVSPKKTIMKAADNLFSLALTVLDYRRAKYTGAGPQTIGVLHIMEREYRTYNVLIKAIMSLSASTFSPLFTALIDWAVKCRDVEAASRAEGQTFRQITLFPFLTLFFKTLKSLVTNYALQIVEPAVAVLQAILEKPGSLPDRHQRQVYHGALTTLQTAFSHDQHSQFSNPSVFELISQNLIRQLTLSLPRTEHGYINQIHIVPTIATFAFAVRSTSSHLKALNSALCSLGRHESAAVRLASVKAHLVLAGTSYQPKPNGANNRRPKEAWWSDADQIGELAEVWCTTALSVGQGMVYMNELLEDDDDQVEREVRRLARQVRVVMGEEGAGMFE